MSEDFLVFARNLRKELNALPNASEREEARDQLVSRLAHILSQPEPGLTDLDKVTFKKSLRRRK